MRVTEVDDATEKAHSRIVSDCNKTPEGRSIIHDAPPMRIVHLRYRVWLDAPLGVKEKDITVLKSSLGTILQKASVGVQEKLKPLLVSVTIPEEYSGENIPVSIRGFI